MLRPALALAAAPNAPALLVQSSTTEAEIRRLEQVEVRAVLAKDTATLRTLWDKDLVVNGNQ
jgi:hypothetical protein